MLFAKAGLLRGDLAVLDSDSALRHRLRRYAAPDLQVIDEVSSNPAAIYRRQMNAELLNR